MSGSMRRAYRWSLPGRAALCVLVIAAFASGCFKLDRSEPATAPLSEIRATGTVTSFELTSDRYTDLHLPGMSPNATPVSQSVHAYYRNGAWRDETSHAPSPLAPVTIRQGDSTTSWMSGQPEATRVTFPPGQVSALLESPPYASGTLEDAIHHFTVIDNAKLTGEATIAGRPTYVVEVAPEPCAGVPPDLAGPLTLWFDRETLKVLKQERRSAADGRLTMRSEVTSIAYDLPLADDLFAPPPGTAIREVAVPAGASQGTTTARIPEVLVPTGSETTHSRQSSSYIVVQSNTAIGGGGLYGDGLSGSCPTPTP